MLLKMLGYYLLIFLPAVFCLECYDGGSSCQGVCSVQYDKSFKFPICCGRCADRYQIPEEDNFYHLFCDDINVCKENNGPAQKYIECYGIDGNIWPNCSSCVIIFTNGGFLARRCGSVFENSKILDGRVEICNEPACNAFPYDHSCYSGYYGDCSWYLNVDKVNSPVKEKCDRLHFVNGCANQTLISNHGRICYMYGCHHKNVYISRAMFREEPRTARTLSNIVIDRGKANATQCYGLLCNTPTTPPKIYCFENGDFLKLCPDYTTSCRMNENGENKRCAPVGPAYLGCHRGTCDCFGDGCNNIGIKCSQLRSTTTVACGFNNYCQIMWDLSKQKIVSQGCVSGLRTFGCRYDENRTVYTCDCPFENCNALGDFKCYQSSNDGLGKLGPCPINTKGCRTIRNLDTKIVKARTCVPVEFPNYPKEEIKPEYEDCLEHGCNIWGNNGTVCYDSNLTKATVCPEDVFYCQTIWNTSNWAIENQGCPFREENFIGCRYNQDKSHLICNCVGDKCNGFGDFKCYQSSNDELGKLAECPINTVGCRTIRDSITKKIKSRSCLLEEFAKYPKENEDLQYEDCHEPGCNTWGNNGTVCYDSNSTEAILCSSDVFYCQTVWSLWTPENITQGCPSSNPSSVGCHFDEDGANFICNCVGEECNKLGDFQCYQSFNHELGRLGPCPINTTGCRTLKDIVTNEIFARGCAPNGLDGPLEEKAEKEGQFYEPCHEPRCNNETIHGRWCPVGVKGRCFETWKSYLVPFHDLLPKPCYGFHDQCHTTKIKTSSGECAIYTCEFFDYNGNVDSTPAIEDETCYKGRNSTHCVCEGDKCLDDVRTLLDMFMNQANGLHFGISLVSLILIVL